MTVVGVDASSTRLAAVILEGKKVHTERLKLSGDIDLACQEAHWWMVGLIRDYNPKMVAVEAPFIHRAHPTGSIGLAQVNGALLGALSGVRTLSVQPSKWKKSVLDNGNANKEQIAAWVREHHPAVAETFVDAKGEIDQDLTDAFCVSLHGLRVLELRDRLLVSKKR